MTAPLRIVVIAPDSLASDPGDYHAGMEAERRRTRCWFGARTHSTVVMVTHDVDEAVLLSDRIVMMTNGPAATIGEILAVDLPRPRRRVDLADNLTYQAHRKAVMDFLYTRQGHVERQAA